MSATLFRRLLHPTALFIIISIATVLLLGLITQSRLLQASAIGLLLFTWGIRPITKEPLPIILCAFAALIFFYTLTIWEVPKVLLLGMFALFSGGIVAAALLEGEQFTVPRLLGSVLLLVEGAHVVSFWTVDPISRAILVATPFALFLRLHPFEKEVIKHPRQFALDLFAAFAVMLVISKVGNWSLF